MRRCSTCKIEKDLSEFLRRPDGKTESFCHPCRKIYQRKYYEEHKSYFVERAARQKLALREHLRYLKETTPCADCGGKFPYFVMDFDHREEFEKEFGICGSLRRSHKRVLAELKKCDTVCANCHRIRTHTRLSARGMIKHPIILPSERERVPRVRLTRRKKRA